MRKNLLCEKESGLPGVSGGIMSFMHLMYVGV